MFHSSDHSGPETTPFVVPDLSGLDRLWAACVAEPVPPTADELRDYVTAHRLLWDMPSLTEIFPEIVEHLEARYLAHHDGDSITVVFTEDCAPETFEVDDVRYVVDILLSREYREALWRESVLPSLDRLAG